MLATKKEKNSKKKTIKKKNIYMYVAFCKTYSTGKNIWLEFFTARQNIKVKTEVKNSKDCF